ncbi:unnamed protein product, partial [marine sediment metagenome]
MAVKTETWPPTLVMPTSLQESVHESHWPARTRILKALAAGFRKRETSTAARLNDCCRGAAFYIDPERGKVRPWMARCHHRLCPFCAVARSLNVSR